MFQWLYEVPEFKCLEARWRERLGLSFFSAREGGMGVLLSVPREEFCSFLGLVVTLFSYLDIAHVSQENPKL